MLAEAVETGAYAIALDPSRARLLEAVGFRRVEGVPFGVDHEVWIGRARQDAPISA